MVEDFKSPCRYELGSFKPFMFLVPENVAINYTIDDGRCAVHSIAQSDSIIKVLGDNVTLTSEENLEGRFKFHNSVELTIQEGSYDRLTDLFHLLETGNKFRAVVEDMMGNQFILNVEFPAFVTHEATFANTVAPNTLTVRLATDSNWPVLFVQSKITYFTQFNLSLCQYVMGGIREFYLGDRKMVRMIENNGKIVSVLSYGSSNFKRITPLPNTLVYTETFDGQKYTQQIQFSIPLSEYKYYFEYNLIEFPDNRYAMLLVTQNNVLLGAGFELGFIPSYTVTASENVSSLNTVDITMQCIAMRPTADTTLTTSLEEFIGDDTRVAYAPVKPFTIGDNQYVGDICINDSQSMYILLELTTTNGAGLSQYAAHVDYAQMFRDAGLDIVTTYSTQGIWNGIPIVHPNPNCAFTSGQCLFRLVPRKKYTLTPINNKASFPVWSECDWTISDIPDWLTVTPMQGPGGSVTQVSIELVTPYPTDPQTSTLMLANPMQDYPFTVAYAPGGSGSQSDCDWLQVEETAFTAAGGTSYFSVSEDMPAGTTLDNLIVVNDGGLDVQVRNGLLLITVPPNLTGGSKYFNVTLRLDQDSQQCTLSIVQDSRYYKRVIAEGYLCDGQYKYQKIAVYWGTEPDNVTNFQGYEKGALLEANSKDCMNFITRWVDGEGFICQGGNKYTYQLQQISYDNGVTWEDTDETRAGDFVGPSDDCDESNFQYEWRWDGKSVVCEGTTSYKLEKRFISYDQGTSWHLTGEQRTGETVRTQDPQCGGNAAGKYRWVEGPGFICDDGNKYKNMEEEYSLDGGLSWTKTGVTRIGDLIQENASECTNSDNWQYDWKISDFAFVCDEDGTSHHLEYYCVSYDGGISWHQTGQQRSDGVWMEHDPRCSDEGVVYRWVDMIGYYVCEDDPDHPGKYCKYQRQKLQSSSDGIVFTDVVPSTQQKGTLLGCNLPQCSTVGGDGEVTYERWVTDPYEYTCNQGNKYHILVKQVSIDNVNWVDAEPRETEQGDLWESNSDDCYIWSVVDGEYICEEAEETWNVDGHICSDTYTDANQTIYYKEDGERMTAHVDVPVQKIGEGKETCAIRSMLNPNMTEITSVPSISYMTQLNNAFGGYTNLAKVECPLWCNVSLPNLNSIYKLFYECTKLATVGLDDMDTSAVEDMEGAFYYCVKLKQMPTGWDVSNVKTFASMFHNCKAITNWSELSNWVPSNASSFYNMLNSIETDLIDLSVWNIDRCCNFQDMFYGAKVTTIKVPTITGNNYCDNFVLELTETGGGSGQVFMRDTLFWQADRYTFYEMFRSAEATTIDCSGFGQVRTRHTNGMFRDCKADTVNLHNFNPVIPMSNAVMFYSAEIGTLDISSWDPEPSLTGTDENYQFLRNDVFTGATIGTIKCKSAMKTWIEANGDLSGDVEWILTD